MTFLKLGFTPCKAEQGILALQGMELRENEAQKH